MAKAPPPPIDDEEDDDLPEDDQAAEFDDDEFVSKRWLQDAFGGRGVGDPRSQESTRLHDTLKSTPIFAAADVEGADHWQVEKRNDETGEADFLGYAHLRVSYPTFIKKFLDSMPDPGEDPATFYFTPLDKLGSKMGTPGKPRVVNIPADNVILQEIRSRVAQDPMGIGSGGTQGFVLTFMQAELARARAEQAELLKRMDALIAASNASKEELLKERAAASGLIQQDISAAYAALGKAQQEMAANLLKTQQEAAKTDTDMRMTEAEARVAAIKAEAAATEARIKAENEAKLAVLKIEAELRSKELEVKAAEAKARVEADRLAWEKQQLREDKKREDERKAEEARVERELARTRDHALAMEKLREDARKDEAARNDAERRRQEEHTRLVISLLEKRMAPETSGSKFGVIGELLDAVGMTPGDAIEKARGMLAGGESVGVTIAQGLFDLGKEVIRRLPAGEEEDEDLEEEDAEEDAASRRQLVDQEVERELERRRRAARARRERERATQPEREPPAERAAPTEPSSPLDIGALETSASANVLEPRAPVIPLAEARAGRAAVAALVERLEDVDPSEWGAAIMQGADADALVRYVSRVGLRVALESYDVDPEAVGQALVEIGLFQLAPLDPQEAP